MNGTDHRELTNRLAVGIGGPVAALVATFGDPWLAIAAIALTFVGPALDYHRSRQNDPGDLASDELEDAEAEVVTDGGST